MTAKPMNVLSKGLAILLILTAAAVNAPSMIDAFATSTSGGIAVWSSTFGGAGYEWAFSVIQTVDGG